MALATTEVQLQELETLVYCLHEEHMRHQNLDVFVHDISVLIAEGLEGGRTVQGLTNHISSYLWLLRKVND